jgi:hypothetical protein
MAPSSPSKEENTSSQIYSAIARYALFLVIILSFLYISWRVAEWVIDVVESYVSSTITPTVVIVTENSAPNLASLTSPLSPAPTEQSIIDMMRTIR